MLNKTKYILAAVMILSAVLITSAGRLDYPREDRECYYSQLAPGVPIYLCFVAGTNAMEASFLTYQPMHEFYTPQLKEVAWNSNMAVSGKRTIRTLDVTGSPSYLYTKHP